MLYSANRRIGAKLLASLHNGATQQLNNFVKTSFSTSQGRVPKALSSLLLNIQSFSASNNNNFRSPMENPEVESHNLASTVVMVRPVDFCFNQETAKDNQFMGAQKIKDNNVVARQAMGEFDKSVSILRKLGVTVVVFDKSQHDELAEIKMPDATFPNNWFTTVDGKIMIYRMKCNSRTLEKMQLPWIMESLGKLGFNVDRVVNWNESIIEGTGALIYDRRFKRMYAARSQRCQGDLSKLAKSIGYELVDFESRSSTSTIFYHTNVVLSIGVQYAVIASYTLGKDKDRILGLLKQQREVIELTPKQVEEQFCGNILQVQGKNSKVLIMSQTAWDGFTQQQQDFFKRNNQIAIFPLQIIQEIGGGSARCMVAEIFLNSSLGLQ